MHVLSDSRCVYGLGNFDRKQYDVTNADTFEVKFVKHHCWELWHLDTALMRVEYGQPGLPKRQYDVAEVEAALQRIFPSISSTAKARLLDMVSFAAKAKHGTMLVISPSARKEARRLAEGGTILPFKATEELITGASAIDGAIVVDLNGVCHGIGVILDGKASKHGDPARGARYNSAVRYLSQHEKCLILVVSEDGMVEHLPK
ncbi:MAG: DNA integrity scanning protein DisA nucleotide-binding domain protein [Pirellulales bacterium]|nr:DNA integrity scanning protein DisA nucleotide-binding domain protein [Pirellulales bacterium]